MEIKNAWVIAMVAALLCLACANAFIHVQQQAWGDVLWALGIIMVIFPIPENMQFINAKLCNLEVESARVNTLHVLAGTFFIAGLLVKALA